MDELRFDGRTAIVTGAGRGLGREYAKLLAARGAAVVVNDLGVEPDGGGSSESPAESVVREIVDAGGRAVASFATVATPEGAASTVTVAVEAFGGVDILVNNAGIIIPASFADTTMEMFEKHIAVNLYGVVCMTQAAWPYLQKSRGNVVNASSSSILGIEPLAAYGAAKGSIFAITRTIALNGAADGIRANNILPMGATRMADHGGSTVPSQEVRDFVEDELAPSKVAPVVAFLAHEACPVTGKSFTAGRNRVALVYIGETEGYRSPTFSVEEMAANFDQVVSKTVTHDFSSNDDMMAYVMSLAPNA